MHDVGDCWQPCRAGLSRSRTVWASEQWTSCELHMPSTEPCSLAVTSTTHMQTYHLCVRLTLAIAIVSLCHATGAPPPSTNTGAPLEKIKCFDFWETPLEQCFEAWSLLHISSYSEVFWRWRLKSFLEKILRPPMTAANGTAPNTPPVRLCIRPLQYSGLGIHWFYLRKQTNN